jgi:hypothetical protein
MTVAALLFVAVVLFFAREYVQELVDRARRREAAEELAAVHECCCRKALDR